MKNSSWDRYQYLFVRDFDRVEWDKIGDFYGKCLQYDAAALAFNSNYFTSNVDKAQSQILRVLADYAKDYLDEKDSENDPDELNKMRARYEQKKQDFLSVYGVIQNTENYDAPYFYNPQRPMLEAKSVLDTIETNITITSIGIKLKRLSGKDSMIKKFFSRLLGMHSVNI